MTRDNRTRRKNKNARKNGRKNVRTNGERATRNVILRNHLRAPVDFVHRESLVLWDLENLGVRLDESGSVAAQIAKFMRVHGYKGAVKIKAYKAGASVLHPRISGSLKAAGVKIRHVKSKKLNAADKAIKKDIMAMIENDEDPKTVVLVSSDCDFGRVVISLKRAGYHSIAVHNSMSTGKKYKKQMRRKCSFDEFISRE